MPNAKLTLGIVVSSLIAACLSATTPTDSTQTGNPPVIHTERVALRVSVGDARVIGEPGAVEPAGAKVEVTNLTSGETTTTEAAEDGSFEVAVDSAEDSYSVHVEAGGESSRPVYVIRGTAAVGDGQDGSLSCEQRNALAGELLGRVAGSADALCTTDADCTAVVPRASCHQPACASAHVYVSERGRAQIERVSGNIDANLCAEYEADGCSHPLPKCPAPAPAVCRLGKCEARAAQEPAPTPELPDCVVCLEQSLEWSVVAGGGITDVSLVEPCASYQRHRASALDGDEVRCQAELVACSAVASTGAIATALAHPDVIALERISANPVRFGDLGDGVFRIRIGIREIELGSACTSALPNCNPVPPGLEALRELLQQIDRAIVAAGPCAAIGG